MRKGILKRFSVYERMLQRRLLFLPAEQSWNIKIMEYIVSRLVINTFKMNALFVTFMSTKNCSEKAVSSPLRASRAWAPPTFKNAVEHKNPHGLP